MRIVCLIGLLLMQAFAGRAQQSPPNIILILADDLGYGDVGFTGSTQIATPHLDALAKSGVIFENGYVSGAVCAPSRAGLLTGINQAEFGFTTNVNTSSQPGYDIDSLGLPLSQKIIPQYLKAAGYVSGLIGKWHLGYQDHFAPTSRGFDEFWGYRGGGHDYFKTGGGKSHYFAPIECNFKEPEALTYLTDDKGDECVAFIERHQDQPFFLYASFNAPHTPLQALDEDLKKYEFITDPKRRTYAAMVDRLDKNVGKIMHKVEELGLSQNTIIVFLSDNGGPVNANHSLNVPWRGMKGTALEGGIHVPFVMSWPGTLPAGSRYPHLVSALDLLPTFLASAGLESPPGLEFTGVNLLPFIKDHAKVPHRRMYWVTESATAIIDDGYKLISFPDRYPELYHLGTDIHEQRNIASQEDERARELLKSLGEWELSLPHPYFQVAPKWKKINLKLYDLDYTLQQPKVSP